MDSDTYAKAGAFNAINDWDMDAINYAHAPGADFAGWLETTIRDAHRAGFSAGLEAGAKLVDRWHIKKGGYGQMAEAIRALMAEATTTTERG